MRSPGRVFVALTLAAAALTLATSAARADVVRAHNDAGATGWYPDQPVLSSVVVPGGQFGQLFASPVQGQVYAQPLVSNNQLLVVTEDNHAYGFDPVTGAKHWERTLQTPWHSADIGCIDLSPNVGITGTPVVDLATNTEYFTNKTYANGVSGAAAYYMHAVDVTTGAERPNFPVRLSGAAANAPSVAFSATDELQRPGLLLMNGVVYAAFGGMCDHKPYAGWVIGVSTAGVITTRWVAQQSGADGAGIWQAGGAIISDRPGSILLATGNGHLVLPGPTAGTTPPGDLSEAVVRLVLQPNGSLKATDFFTPYDAPTLDVTDADFGSGGPVALPESYNGTPLFGTAAHPHLMLEEGKAGYIFLLDRDNLGGYRNGQGGADNALARMGPYGAVWSTPAVWPGDGGYVYVTHGAGAGGFGVPSLRAYKYGIDGKGNPTFVFVAKSDDAFGFGSGSPVVTSDGLTPGSALVWVVWQPDGGGGDAQLRAYDATPTSGSLHLRWSAPIGTATKFAPPAVNDNRVYVGTRDGFVRGFGYPVDLPLEPSPPTLFFPSTIVNQTAVSSITFTANTALTVNTLTSSDPAFVVGTPSIPLPASLAPNDTLTVPVTFQPQTRSIQSGALHVALAGGQETVVGMEGVGRLATGDLQVFPSQLSLGGAPLGGSPVSGGVTFINAGAGPLHVTGTAVPPASTNISVTGLPAIGATIPGGASVVVTVTYRPRTIGVSTGTVQIRTDAPPPGRATNSSFVSASTAAPAHLTIDPLTAYIGPVRIGNTLTRSVVLKNVGHTPMTVTKSKPPDTNVGFTALTAMPEGTQIAPGVNITLTVKFTATRIGHFTDTWVVNGDDDTGLHTITFDATAMTPKSSYWMADGVGHVYPLGTAGGFGHPTPPAGSTIVALVPTVTGNGYYMLDDHGRVYSFGGARPLGSVATSSLRPYEIATSIAVTPSARGYWVFTSMGRVFTFGDARNYGDMSAKRLAAPVVASVATATGKGYYMVAGDGGVFNFGDAKFFGSMGGRHLNRPVVSIVSTATGAGYWLAASDGGVFRFGDAPFLGSMGGRHLNQPVCGMVRYSHGYLMVAADGGVFDFSDAPFVGSLGDRRLPAPIVTIGAFAI